MAPSVHSAAYADTDRDSKAGLAAQLGRGARTAVPARRPIPRLGRVNRETLGAAVLEVLRASILGGRFAGGERLVEATLAEEMGISRGPLREALVLLEKDGLIVTLPRRGRYVVEFTTRDVDEHYGLRRVLETYAVELLVDRASREKDRILERAWEQIHKAATVGDAHQSALADLAFHDTIYRLTDDQLLTRIWRESLSAKLQLLVNVTTIAHAPLHQESSDHRLILDALLDRNVELAKAEVNQHIDDAWPRIRAAVESGAWTEGAPGEVLDR